jgi:hypothetical protein
VPADLCPDQPVSAFAEPIREHNDIEVLTALVKRGKFCGTMIFPARTELGSVPENSQSAIRDSFPLASHGFIAMFQSISDPARSIYFTRSCAGLVSSSVKMSSFAQPGRTFSSVRAT